MGGSEKTVVQTIIKRKIRNPEEPQENGGWKVAYADFVTAMMAFFMVMWLLSSANEDQRRGIAGYFRPSSDLNRAETGSQSMLDKGILHGGDTLYAAREAKLESLEAQSSSADERHQNAAQKDLKAIKTLFSDLYKEKLGRPLSEAQIGFHLSDEGFQFDFFESKGTELFDASQNPKTALIKLLDIIAKMTAHIEYPLAVEAHVQAAPLVVKRPQDWTISSARAGNVRVMLQRLGVPETRIKRNTAHGDNDPISDNPMAQQNNRVSIVFLNLTKE